jgi:hypothetical protein
VITAWSVSSNSANPHPSSARDQLANPVGHARRDLTQLGKDALAELRGNHVVGMGEAGRVGDMRGEITHPLDQSLR